MTEKIEFTETIEASKENIKINTIIDMDCSTDFNDLIIEKTFKNLSRADADTHNRVHIQIENGEQELSLEINGIKLNKIQAQIVLDFLNKNFK